MCLVLNGVTKCFKDKIAIKSINLHFGKGIYGLLGANGAGKTTMIRCICDLYKIDEGSITFKGQSILALKEEYRDKLGYLPQDFGYYPDYTALNFLLYLAAIKGISRKPAKEKAISLLKEVGLFDERNKKLKNYSGGMLRRIGIAQALLNDPEILILDEPTAGLDPKERIRFKNILSRYSENHIVIISTHIVSDIEFIAKKIILLQNGNILKIGTRNELLESVNGKVWEGKIDVSQTNQICNNFKISSIKNEGTNNMVRIIANVPPSSDFISVAPTLDDLYLFYFGEVSQNETAI